MKRSWLIIIIAVILLVLVGGGLAFYLSQRSASESAVHIPESIRSRASFPLYIPEKLPEDMSIDEKSFSGTDQVVAYQVKYDGSKILNVSIQPRDPSIDPENYPGDESFNSSIGRAIIISRDDRTTAAVFADKSWLLMNASQQISSDQLRTFINSLRQN